MAEYIDKNELYQVESLLKTSIVETDEVASFILEQVLHDIENFPAADVAPVVRGKWIGKPLDNFKKYQVTCSECGWIGIENYDSYVDPSDFNYCPNCGANMEYEEDDL